MGTYEYLCIIFMCSASYMYLYVLSISHTGVAFDRTKDTVTQSMGAYYHPGAHSELKGFSSSKSDGLGFR